MSHMAAIDLQVQDIDSLAVAVESLGLQFNRGQKTWRWFGSWMNDYSSQDAAYKQGINPEEYGKCADHVITIPGDNSCYEVGVVARRDGKPGWILLYDFWGTQGQKMVDKISGKAEIVDAKGQKSTKSSMTGKLEQAYTMAVTSKHLTAQGYKVKIKQSVDGKMYCEARRPKQKLKSFR